MYCKVCGVLNSEGVRFCKNCGNPFQETASHDAGGTTITSSSAEPRRSFLKRNLPLLLVLLIGGALYFVYENFIKFKPDLVGAWIDVETESEVFSIKKNGRDYLVSGDGTSYPAKLERNELKVADRFSFAIVKKPLRLLVDGEQYKPMDGSQFEGFWLSRNDKEILGISREGDGYTVKWKSHDDGFFQEHVIPCTFQDGVLTGDYYGSTGNFKLKVAGKEKIAFTLDPFAEFEPIRNLLFSNTIPSAAPANFDPVPQETKTVDNEIESVTQQGFYIVNVAAVKTEDQAKAKVQDLTATGKEANYLWIPDFASLSGAQFYSVYLGPYKTQRECEFAVEEYRKIDPAAYGLFVSQDNKRVQINGIGKVVITPK